MQKIYFIPILFMISLCSQGLMICYVTTQIKELQNISFIVQNTDQAQKLASIFQSILNQNYVTLLIFQVHSFIFFQTWCIPGTFFFNLIGGSLFGLYIGFSICLTCNVIGSFLCFSMSKYLAAEFVRNRLQNKIIVIQKQLNENQENQFLYLISLRLFPGSPNWMMNITFPHLGIKSSDFIASVFIGLSPWNFMTCQAGQILSNLKDNEIIIKPANYLILIVLAIGLALINYFRKSNRNRKKNQKTL